VDGLSGDEARAIAVTAQGLGQRPRRNPRLDDLKAVVDRLGLVQIDSVNVLARAHYLPFFARLGPYRQELLDELAYRERYVFEQWGHEASFIPTADYSLFQHRMERGHRYWTIERLAEGRREYFDDVLEQVRERGAVTIGNMENAGRRQGWWGWSHAKMALEWHFAVGNLAVRERRNFARVYDLPERVFPEEVLSTRMSATDAQREMLRRAAAVLGVGTARDLADYYRLKAAEAKPRLAELIDAGELVPVAVEGWNEPAYLWPAAADESRASATALVSPFDSLVWFRQRTERLFGFHYRIEIYTPEAQRKFGYYVLPFLHNNRLVARVDLKANRQAKMLEVKAAHLEPGAKQAPTARALAKELRLMQRWLGLERMSIAEKGDLAPALRAAAAPGEGA
jgi:hypothetical protein